MRLGAPYWDVCGHILIFHTGLEFWRSSMCNKDQVCADLLAFLPARIMIGTPLIKKGSTCASLMITNLPVSWEVRDGLDDT